MQNSYLVTFYTQLALVLHRYNDWTRDKAVQNQALGCKMNVKLANEATVVVYQEK